MNEILQNELTVISIFIAAVIGSLITYIYLQRKLSKLREKNSALSTRLEVEQQNNNEKIESIKKERAQLSDMFTALSSQALKNNNEEFLKLAPSAAFKNNLQQKVQEIRVMVR